MKTEVPFITFSGDRLTIDQLVQVARYRAPVALSDSPQLRKRVEASRAALDRVLGEGEIIYGVNTGYGGNVKFLIPPSQVNHHQKNLLQDLSCGTGPALSQEVVRGSMLLRANALCKGYSAARLLVIERLADLLNAGIVPIVPRYGSVGASGDLLPSAYIAKTLLGLGKVSYGGRTMEASEALRQASIAPIELQAKEGLALVNGTSVMTSLAALNIHDAEYLAAMTVAVVALTVESLHRVMDPFDPIVQMVKNHPGQKAVAWALQRLTEGSTFVKDLESIRAVLKSETGRAESTIEAEVAIQDPYSLRCTPQGLGPVFESLEFARTVTEREMNSANDNPLVDPDSGSVHHTGNFYGGYIARVMDGLKLDICVLANWLNSLMALLVDPRFSSGLPANLSPDPGLNSGFKGMQMSLCSLVCALRQMSGPSLIHTLPTEQYNQDVVSLGLHSASTATDMIPLLRNAISIVLLADCQGIDLRRTNGGHHRRMGSGTAPIYHAIRQRVAFLDGDRPMDEDIARVTDLIWKRAFETPLLETAQPSFSRLGDEGHDQSGGLQGLAARDRRVKEHQV